MDTRAIILEQPPSSADYEELRFDADGDCLWVLFRPSDGDDWVGVFGCGVLGGDSVAISDSGQTACVLAGGLAYVVRTEGRVLLHSSRETQLQRIVAVPLEERFVAADFIRLHAYTAKGLEWSSERISLDGIRFGSADRQGLNGEVWTITGWVSFRLVFNGWRYVCEWKCPHD